MGLVKLSFEWRGNFDSNQFEQSTNMASWRQLIWIIILTWFRSHEVMIQIMFYLWFKLICPEAIPNFQKVSDSNHD